MLRLERNLKLLLALAIQISMGQMETLHCLIDNIFITKKKIKGLWAVDKNINFTQILPS